jgi:hypothetical protein
MESDVGDLTFAETQAKYNAKPAPASGPDSDDKEK